MHWAQKGARQKKITFGEQSLHIRICNHLLLCLVLCAAYRTMNGETPIRVPLLRPRPRYGHPTPRASVMQRRRPLRPLALSVSSRPGRPGPVTRSSRAAVLSRTCHASCNACITTGSAEEIRRSCCRIAASQCYVQMRCLWQPRRSTAALRPIKIVRDYTTRTFPRADAPEPPPTIPHPALPHRTAGDSTWSSMEEPFAAIRWCRCCPEMARPTQEHHHVAGPL